MFGEPKRSLLGAYRRSTLGVKNFSGGVFNREAEDIIVMTDEASAIRYKIYTLTPASYCRSRRTDHPYGTQSGLINTTTTPGGFVVGQNFTGVATTYLRTRIGRTFALAAYNTGTTVLLNGRYVSDSGTLASKFNVFYSDGDDSGLYTTDSAKAAWDWETSNDHKIVEVNPANPSASYSYGFSFAEIGSFFGGNMSFLFTSKNEIEGSDTVDALYNSDSGAGGLALHLTVFEPQP